MKKETIICVIVVILIVFINFIETKNTEKTFDELNTKLDEVRMILASKEEKDLKEDVNEIIKEWKDKNEILAFYIEHNELEKLEMYLWELSSYIETEEDNMAIQVLDTCKYMIAHIKEKYDCSLKNVF